MRILALDHFYEQDLDALQQAAGDDVELRTVGYEPLLLEARRLLPSPDDEVGERFWSEELRPHRERYARWLRRFLEDEFAARPFDVFLSPSDVFFYVRAAPEILHRLGVPFFVAQKETTIAPHLMGEHARHVGRWWPVIADHMTVCSERHKEFWVRTGADPGVITVTGQPRFDFYRRPEQWPERLPYAHDGDGPTVLFLSYMLDAYHPEIGAGRPIWRAMHTRTEEALRDLAERGWRVLVKPHPQEPRDMRRELRERFGSLWGRRAHLVDPLADTRPLIALSDVVVGFQSTALLEAMMARKPIVYTAWDEEARRVSADLIPFHEMGDILTVADTPDGLPETIEAARTRGMDERAVAAAAPILDRELGPIDGHAYERTLARIAETVREFEAGRTPEVERHREQVAARRPARLAPWRLRHGLRRTRRAVGAALGR